MGVGEREEREGKERGREGESECVCSFLPSLIPFFIIMLFDRSRIGAYSNLD